MPGCSHALDSRLEANWWKILHQSKARRLPSETAGRLATARAGIRCEKMGRGPAVTPGWPNIVTGRAPLHELLEYEVNYDKNRQCLRHNASLLEAEGRAQRRHVDDGRRQLRHDQYSGGARIRRLRIRGLGIAPTSHRRRPGCRGTRGGLGLYSSYVLNLHHPSPKAPLHMPERRRKRLAEPDRDRRVSPQVRQARLPPLLLAQIGDGVSLQRRFGER